MHAHHQNRLTGQIMNQIIRRGNEIATYSTRIETYTQPMRQDWTESNAILDVLGINNKKAIVNANRQVSLVLFSIIPLLQMTQDLLVTYIFIPPFFSQKQTMNTCPDILTRGTTPSNASEAK